MPSHCRCCSGKFVENDVLGDCPGCPECAEKYAEIASLHAATRKVVEALQIIVWKRKKKHAGMWINERDTWINLEELLANPTIVALGREHARLLA